MARRCFMFSMLNVHERLKAGICHESLSVQTKTQNIGLHTRLWSAWSAYGSSWPQRCFNFEWFAAVFLGAFAKLRKATLSFVMSAYPHGKTRFLLDGFWWNFIFELVSKICREYSSFIKIRQEQRVLYVKTFLHFWRCLVTLFLEWEMF